MGAAPTSDTSKTAEYGTIEEIDGRHVIRFERLLPHPVEKVWDSLTTPERMQDWFGEGEIELDLVEGGAFEVRITGPAELVDAIISVAGEEGLIQHNTILRVEPPLVLEHTFGAPESVVRWELQPEGDGCRLMLTHTEPPGFSISEGGPHDLAGWHTLLERLAGALAGERNDWRLERWQGLREEYAVRLSG